MFLEVVVTGTSMSSVSTPADVDEVTVIKNSLLQVSETATYRAPDKPPHTDTKYVD